MTRPVSGPGLQAPIACLVLAPNWVGDLVMAFPVLQALAASGRHLSVLARPHLVPLLRLTPWVGAVLERAPDDRETIARMAGGGIEEAVVLPNSFRSAWLAYRAGIPYRWGYAGNLRTLLLHPAVPRPWRRRPDGGSGGRHQTRDYAGLLAAMAVDPPSDWIPRLRLPEEVAAAGRERLERAGIAGRGEPGEGPLIGLSPGAEFGPSKRWPWRRFAELARELRRRLPAVRQVILVGPQEVWLGVRVHEESSRLHPVVGPDLDLAGLAGVLSRLDLLVTNDSGPMHLAAALGVPTVALFGPTDPDRTAPAGQGHRVLYTDRWCSPCFQRRCPLLHHRCLKDIGSGEVAAACLAALGGG